MRGPGSQTRVTNKEAPESPPPPDSQGPSLGCIGSKDSHKGESPGMEIF